MSPSDWLLISIRIPLLAVPVLTLLLLVLIVVSVAAGRRWVIRTRALADEIGNLRSRLARKTEQEAEWTSARDAYLHFVYNVSHEIANPLQSIQTNLDNMGSCSVDEVGRWQQYYQIIVAEILRLVRLTENLRLLSRLETPGAPAVRESVNLKGVIEDVIMTMHETAETRGVRLRYVGPQRPARVLGNRDHLRQVLMNLVDNGIKYSQDEGGQVNISIVDEQDRLCVRVSDEGIGIDTADQPYIFDTVYRSPDARSFRRRGSGLGLPIVRRIVEQHEGTIHVHSELGKGTIFSFDLPLYLPSERLRRDEIETKP